MSLDRSGITKLIVHNRGKINKIIMTWLATLLFYNFLSTNILFLQVGILLQGSMRKFEALLLYFSGLGYGWLYFAAIKFLNYIVNFRSFRKNWEWCTSKFIFTWDSYFRNIGQVECLVDSVTSLHLV